MKTNGSLASIFTAIRRLFGVFCIVNGVYMVFSVVTSAHNAGMGVWKDVVVGLLSLTIGVMYLFVPLRWPDRAVP